MATHKSALKRAKQNEVKRLRNMSYKTRVKKAVKEVRDVVASDSEDQARESRRKAVSITQNTASKGVIHRKKASRKISRIARQVNQITSP